MGINHHFARCLRLHMREFKFEGKIYICSLTPCLFVQSFNMHWWSSSWLYLTKEIVSKFRRFYLPAHSKKSPPYSILEGASAVSSWANLLRKPGRVLFYNKNPAHSEKSPPYPLLSKSDIPPMIGCLCCNKYCCRWCLLFCVCIWPTFGRLSLKAWREPAQCLRWGLTCWESVRESFLIKKIRMASGFWVWVYKNRNHIGMGARYMSARSNFN